MVYATCYGFKITGRVVAGPNVGTVLDGHRQEAIDCDTLADAVAKAESYRGLFVGTLAVYSRQYADAARGFVFCWDLATVTLP